MLRMNEQNMQQIYEENARAVYKYLFCLTRNPDLSEELTQETFYQATKGLSKFRGECKISVWLCQIAKRLWYKELEKRKRQTVSLDDVAHEMRASEDVEVDYLQTLSKIELFKQLHGMDEQTREVIYLRLTGELSFAQIGEILGKTETWARVTFYRGKQKLTKGKE